MDPFESAAHTKLSQDLEQALSCLTIREADIIRWRFGLKDGKGHTLDEIAQVYGLSRERVRQIERHAMQLLKKRAEKSDLRDYFL